MRVGADAGRDAHLHAAGRRPPAASRSSRSISSALSSDDVRRRPRRAPARSSSSVLALPWTWIRAGSKPGAQRRAELAAAGDVAGQALLREAARSTAVQGKALDAKWTSTSSAVGGEGRAERARPRAQVVLGDDVGRRAELARELDEVAAADLQPAALVDAAAQREHVRDLLRHGHRRRIMARRAHRPRRAAGRDRRPRRALLRALPAAPASRSAGS